MLTPTAQIVADAAARGTGAPAFNGITLEHGEAIVLGAERAGLPVILALSHNAVRYHGALRPVAAAYRALAEAAAVPVGLHLDHVEDLGLVEETLTLGFGSVMYDAAMLPYGVALLLGSLVAEQAPGHDGRAELGSFSGRSSSCP